MTGASNKVIIIGGLGNGSVIAAAIDDARAADQSDWVVAGYLNDRVAAGSDLEGHTVLGPLSDTKRFIERGFHFIYAIYRIDGQDRRIALWESLGIPEEQLATFVHPKAYVAANAQIGPGSVVMPQVSISSGARLGRCCLVMVGANIGHNSEIGNYCHLAAQSCLGAFLKVGQGVHICLNASVRENLTLGACSALAMGGVLLNDMGPYEIWGGVPAKFLRQAGRELG